MITGKINSRMGDKLIIKVESSDLNSVKRLQSKSVFVEGKKIGKVSEIIGNVCSPYIVVKIFKNIHTDNLNKEISIK